MKKSILLFYFLLYTISMFGQSTLDSSMWVLKITGMSSAMVKTLYGNANDSYNFSKVFKTATSGMENEKLVVEMTFPGTNVLLTDTLSYSNAKNFFKKHSILLSKCDYYEYGATENSKWIPPFYRTKNSIVSEIDEKTVPAEGNGSFYLGGTSLDSDDKHFVGSLTRRFSPLEIYTNAPPEKCWVSFYLKGEGDTTAVFRLGIWEKSKNSIHNSFYYIDIPLVFTGWKHVAIRYSDMVFLKSSTSYFNSVRNFAAINSINYTLFSNDPTKKVELHLDNLILLFNGTN